MSFSRTLGDGRINLEQQRKRAKELLRQWRRDPASRTGLPGQEPRLADAQWQVARELGFASWPRLKAHVDAIAFASRHPDLVGGDEAATLHLRCGNDIAHGLKLAGFRGDFRMFADPLTMGPVPNLPLPEFLALRSDYLSRAFDLDPADAQARQRQEYAGLERLGEYSRVALWCEADAYDQLFLVRVLAGMQTPPEHLELIEIDRVPGVERFVGIGQLAPELLAWLWTQRRPLDAEALALARAAWDAYRDPAPLRWAQLAAAPTPALPLLGPALRRQLHELPALRDGLSLSERLTLEIVRDGERPSAGQVFAELTARREPLPYLGDLMFRVLLRALLEEPGALLRTPAPELPWERQPLALTAAGREVLAGRRYRLDLGAPNAGSAAYACAPAPRTGRWTSRTGRYGGRTHGTDAHRPDERNGRAATIIARPFSRTRPPMKKIPLAAADPDRLDTWVKYREGLCGECNATCCTLPVEVRIDDLIRMRLVDEFEREEPAKRIAKRLEKDGVIEHFNHKREIFTLTRMANGDCLYLDRKTRLCTIYARRPDTCRNHPRIGPRPGYCAYRPR